MPPSLLTSDPPVIAVGGFILYAAFAPHSIAAAEISLAIVGGGWLVRTLATGKMGFRRTQLDLPIWLFVLWTIASAVFSQEPRISMAKLQSVCVFFLFYLTQAVVRRRTAIFLVSIMRSFLALRDPYSAFTISGAAGAWP